MPSSSRTRTASTALTLAGATVVVATATRDLVYNPTALRVKPVVTFPTWPLAALAVAVASGWILSSERRVRGLLAVGGGAVLAALFGRWAVFRPAAHAAPTTAATLGFVGSLAIVAGGAAAFVAPLHQSPDVERSARDR
jgi:hypothetical protein